MERAILDRWKSLGQKLNMWRKLNMKLFHTLIAGFSLLAAFTATGENTDFRFVDLKSAVNRGFRDETAGDGRGGWFDQGPANDMSGFKSGVRNFSGVPFRMSGTMRSPSFTPDRLGTTATVRLLFTRLMLILRSVPAVIIWLIA